MDYLDWRTCVLTIILVLQDMYINLVEVGDGDIKTVARVNVLDTFSYHSCMSFSSFSWRIIYIMPGTFGESNTSISHITGSTTLRVAITHLLSPQARTTNSASSSPASSPLFDLFFSGTLPASCTIRVDNGRWWGSILVLAGWFTSWICE